MTHAQELQKLGIDAYLERYRQKDLLRFLTCGSVDDGKSTLIGRMLHDSEQVFEDQLDAAKKDSARYGTTGDAVDLALLVDGLEAEREQGITIDVAYRYFTTSRRKFIIADTPGHEQYTRNMATGASNCDLAVILIDARKGVLDQTRRHSFIASLLGIRHIVVAVNKMDLVGWKEATFEKIRSDYIDFAAKLQVADLHFIPMSALTGDNVVHRSQNMPWFGGSPLLDHLETVTIASDRNLIDMRLPVQAVLRPDLDFRGYAGTLASGILRQGDGVVALPSGKRTTVRSIETFGGRVDEAFAPMSVCVTLDDEIDISRGDQIVHPNNAPRLAHTIEAMLVWMSEKHLTPGRTYLIKHTTNQTEARVADLRYRIDVNTLHSEDASALRLNEIGRVTLETVRPLAYDSYRRNRALGSFILIDRLDNSTVAAGMIVDRLPAERSLGRRTASADAGLNLQAERPRSSVSVADREARLGQTPVTIWMTGLPRSGKTSIAFALEAALFERGLSVHVLDGESLRGGLSQDLGFAPEDRLEHQRRAAEVARLMNDQGLITIAALVSPSRADRAVVARVIGAGRFFLVHCDCPVEVCESRDTAGLYERARRGEIRNLTGVDAPYEAPADADLVLDTAAADIATNVQRVLDALESRGVVPRG